MLQQVSSQTKGWIYGISSQVLWGTAAITIKLISGVIPSSLLVFLRNIIGSVTLSLLIVKNKTPIFKNISLIHIIILGLFAVLPEILLIEAVRRAGAIIAAMLARIEIPLGVIFAHLLLKEKVGRNAYVAGIISIVGVWIISYQPGLTLTFDNQFYVGVLCALGSAILWGLSSVFSKHILNKKIDPLAFSFIRMSIGALYALVITIILIQSPFSALKQLSLQDWLLVGYLGVFVSGIAYLFFYRALKLLDAHVAILLLGLMIIVILFCGLLVGETIKPIQWLGIGMIIASIFLIKRSAPAKE